jgi:hypothetical protein
VNHFFDELNLRSFSFYASNGRKASGEGDFYQWRQRNKRETLEARLTEKDVQEYTTSEYNQQKRHRRGMDVTLNEIASWLEGQRARLRYQSMLLQFIGMRKNTKAGRS